MEATVGQRDTSPGPGALAGALARVGDRWSLLVVEALGEGARRFAELQASLPGIATNVLSQRLRHLEEQRVLVAVPYSDRPRRYAYELTDEGQALQGVARLLAQWSADHGGGEANTPAHPACGTPMVARWWCPTCDQPSDVGPPDLVWA